MKKTLIISLTTIIYLAITSSAHAAETLCPDGASDFNVLCNLKITGVIGPIINLVFVVSVMAALLYLVWGGFKWLTSGGDKGAVGSAREHIVAAIAGLVIIFLSYFILNFVVGFFIPGFKLNDFDLPKIGTPARGGGGGGGGACIRLGNDCGGGLGTNCCRGTCKRINPGIPDRACSL